MAEVVLLAVLPMPLPYQGQNAHDDFLSQFFRYGIALLCLVAFPFFLCAHNDELTTHKRF